MRPNGSGLTRSPFELFTHVTTHEFHHKGQVVSMSRQLGYTPVDTDVIRE
ncbi:MAG: DinB family protein [Sphingobacteriales bacterium]